METVGWLSVLLFPSADSAFSSSSHSPFPPVPPPPTKAASPTPAVAAQPEAPGPERPLGASEPCQTTSAFPGRQQKRSQRENGGVERGWGMGQSQQGEKQKQEWKCLGERLTESHRQPEAWGVCLGAGVIQGERKPGGGRPGKRWKGLESEIEAGCHCVTVPH